MIATNAIPAVAYLRRSTDMQERSIPDQRAYIERWARERGYRLTGEYVDDAISGTSARGRAAFERMLADAESGPAFKAVLCYDMSRFSRGGTNETGYYLHRLSMAGVEAVFCAEGIPEGEEGELLQGVKSWQARQYSVKLSRDSIRGQYSTVTVRKSGMGGRAPYGYDRQYVSENGQVLRTVRTLPDGRRQEFGPDGRHLRFIEPKQKLPKKMKSDIVRLVPGDPKHIAVVKDIFKMCAEGYGFRSIVIALNDRGISGPMNTRWNQMAVKSILQNPCYRGALAWNRRTFGKIHEVALDGSPVSKKMPTSTRNPTDRWIVIEDVHEPIVDASLFQKAQEQMTARRDKGGLARPTRRYLLSGLLRCTHCGFNYWGCIHKNASGEIRYYADAGYRAQGKSVCKATHIQADALDAWVLTQVRDVILGSPDAVQTAIARFVETARERDTQPSPEAAIKSEMAAITKRIKATVNLLADGDLADVDELRDSLVELKRKRDALAAQLSNAPTPAMAPDENELRAWAIEKLRDLDKAIRPGAITMEMRRVVHEYVDRIEVDPHTKSGTLYLPDNAFEALRSSRVRRETSASSSHSCSVLVVARRGSPRRSSSGVSCGLMTPMTSETSSANSGSVAPPSYVALPVNAMVRVSVCGWWGSGCVASDHPRPRRARR